MKSKIGLTTNMEDIVMRMRKGEKLYVILKNNSCRLDGRNITSFEYRSLKNKNIIDGIGIMKGEKVFYELSEYGKTLPLRISETDKFHKFTVKCHDQRYFYTSFIHIKLDPAEKWKGVNLHIDNKHNARNIFLKKHELKQLIDALQTIYVDMSI